MARLTLQLPDERRRERVRMAREAWALAEDQHGVVSSDQLLGVAYSRQAIHHRIRTGRLHPLHRGVYAVGRSTVTDHGRWMAAVLACPGSAVSHSSAAALWRMGPEKRDLVELSLPSLSRRRRPGLQIHQRPSLKKRDLTREYGIPVTTPVQTLIDMSLRLDRPGVERMINEADKYNLTHPPQLREALDERPGEKGVAKLRFILDRRTFRLTKEELERRFLPLARKAGLTTPLTGQIVNGFEVDFYWPDLGLVVETDGLVVETDGLRYHRTPAEQARDRLRDQTHTAGGLTPLRFTHEQVSYEPEHVLAVLQATGRTLAERAAQTASRLAISTK